MVGGGDLSGLFMLLSGGLVLSVYAGLGLWLLMRRKSQPSRAFERAPWFLTGLFAMAAWGGATVMAGAGAPLTFATEQLANCVWLLFLFAAWRSHRRGPGGGNGYLLFTVLMLLTATLAGVNLASGTAVGAPYWLTKSIIVQTLLSIGGLIAIDLAMRVVGRDDRRPWLLCAGAIAALWAYDFNLNVIAWLGGQPAATLILLRPLFALLLVPVFIMAVLDRPSSRMRLSRPLTYRTVALGGISAYLVLMASLAMLVRLVGVDYGNLAQALFLIAGLIGGVVLASSVKVRGWIMVILAKHFFEHRYDYRAAWTSFTRTLGRDGDQAQPLNMRVINAVAELTGSPGGILLLPDDGGRLVWAAGQRAGDIDPAAASLPTSAALYLQHSKRIIAIGSSVSSVPDDMVMVPDWLAQWRAAWVVVPLIHGDRLVGALVLTRPTVQRALDWEDLDVLRVAGQQAASFLAEARAEAALSEAQRFDEFNRRFAFIMHDVKNIASQLSLLARNAERHAENRDFRRDMIATLQLSAGRLSELTARLSRSGGPARAVVGPVTLGPLVDRLAAAKRSLHPVGAGSDPDLIAHADPGQVEQILGHLVQNAIEASAPDSPVTIIARRDGDAVAIDVIDQGCGMDADFIRSHLFRPFVSTKDSGFGIGAFEALGLARAMGGTIEVESHPGEGSRMTLRLPAWHGDQVARPDDDLDREEAA